ncbi:hypothetical protein NMY22_g17865 [Coprinellus aureogranulatus]|nr:hypothetical protein NMY22_g17865 [Coprinellus aureogranulatus]
MSSVSFSSCLETDTFSTDAFPSPPVAQSTARARRTSDRSPFAASTTDVDKVPSVERSMASLISLTPPTLKKAISHQSLIKRAGPLFSPSSSTQTLISPTREQEKEKRKERDPEKTPSKMRIFTPGRIPMPPMPSKQSHLSGSTSNDPTPQDQKRVSAGSVRKRLFSGSSLRRPSTSQSNKDEDAQSVLSCKSDQDMYINKTFFKPWISTQSSGPSFWEESPDTAPGSPTGSGVPFTNEPMSPTLGRYEHVRTCPPLTFSSPTLTRAARQRGFSVRSSNTVASMETDDESVLSGMSPRSHSATQSRFQRSNTITTTSRAPDVGIGQISSLGVNAVGPRPRTANGPASAPPRKSSDRPSTAQGAFHTGHQLSSAAAVERAFSYAKPTESPPAAMTSLPPPPRRNRPRPVLAPPTEESPHSPPALSPSASPAIPSSLPSPVQIASPALPTAVISLQPPPRRTPRPKISFEKFIHRRSIMKKPSFLDFDNDEDEDEVDVGDPEILDEREDVIELFDEPRSRVSSMRSMGVEDRRPPSLHSSSRNSSAKNLSVATGIRTPPLVSESFLDFARESFDSTRSDAF